MTETASLKLTRNAVLLVLVASLGYFVDIYDLVIFSIVRVKSLHDIGVADGDANRLMGVHIINMQMLGLLVGGIFWVYWVISLDALKCYLGRSFCTR